MVYASSATMAASAMGCGRSTSGYVIRPGIVSRRSFLRVQPHGQSRVVERY
jgi:hypothetical protein